MKVDKTKWYKINYEALENLDIPTAKNDSPSVQNEQTNNQENTQETPSRDIKKTKQKSSAPVAKSSQATPKKPTHTFDAERVPLPPFVDLEAWIGFVQHRKALRKPIATQRTADLLFKSLERLSGAHLDTATAILNQSCERGWTGVFALKVDFDQAQAQPRPNKPKFDPHNDFANRDYSPPPRTDGRPEWSLSAMSDDELPDWAKPTEEELKAEAEAKAKEVQHAQNTLNSPQGVRENG